MAPVLPPDLGSSEGLKSSVGSPAAGTATSVAGVGFGVAEGAAGLDFLANDRECAGWAKRARRAGARVANLRANMMRAGVSRTE